MRDINEKMKERKIEKMTVEKALSLTPEEFEMLYREHDGFNKEVYSNHPFEKSEDAFYDFLSRGCARLKGIRLFQKD